uniref:uncharacterized protein LOC118144919 n=1 Tax=Callithrix jacchus TaxID=9483 RepID=UPI00159DE642|nr:uncharacterized protein LOC118144919 [Callithrix jacchus]
MNLPQPPVSSDFVPWQLFSLSAGQRCMWLAALWPPAGRVPGQPGLQLWRKPPPCRSGPVTPSPEPRSRWRVWELNRSAARSGWGGQTPASLWDATGTALQPLSAGVLLALSSKLSSSPRLGLCRALPPRLQRLSYPSPLSTRGCAFFPRTAAPPRISPETKAPCGEEEDICIPELIQAKALRVPPMARNTSF